LPHSATLLPLLLRTSVAHRDLSSFPTRRSSDLSVVWITESSSVTFIPRFLHVARSGRSHRDFLLETAHRGTPESGRGRIVGGQQDRKSTRLNSSHVSISYAVFCLKKKMQNKS